MLWITSTSGYVWFSVVHSLRWTLKNQKRFYASFLTWHRTGKGAPGVNLFLNLPGPPGSQMKINVYVQQFTFIWEISQELSEPYQSVQGRGGCRFHSSPGIRLKSRHLFDQTSLKFVVWQIFLFYCYWTAQAEKKGCERKVHVILCCEILYQFLADCDRSKRAKGKAAWFFVCVDLWTVLNVAASKSQSWTKETLSL